LKRVGELLLWLRAQFQHIRQTRRHAAREAFIDKIRHAIFDPHLRAHAARNPGRCDSHPAIKSSACSIAGK